jgi:hypothetical protein
VEKCRYKKWLPMMYSNRDATLGESEGMGGDPPFRKFGTVDNGDLNYTNINTNNKREVFVAMT